MLFSVLLALTTVAQPVTWQGVSLGEPMSAVVARLGDPVKIKKGTSVSTLYLYFQRHRSSIFMLSVERGRVRGVRVAALKAEAYTLTDGHGIALGATEEQLTTLDGKPTTVLPASPDVLTTLPSPVDVYNRPDGIWSYEIIGGRISSIQRDELTSNFAALPTVADPLVHGGTSFDDAIVDKADNESDGVHNEYIYLQNQACAPGVRWQTTQQSLLNHGKKIYDRLDTICPTTKEKRSFYFDITAYFGKI